MDRHQEARERALELIAQVDETLDRAAIAAAERSIRGEQDHPATPDWHGIKSTGQMSTAQFSAWLDAGRPALVADEGPSPRERRREAQDRMRENIALRAQIRNEMHRHTQHALEQFASMLGAEIGLTEKHMLTNLKAEIAELRGQIEDLHAAAARDVTDLPALKLIGGRHNAR